MIEFGAGGAIMHTEEPTATEPQPAETAETPTVVDAVPPAAATGSAEEDQTVPAGVPEIVVVNAESPTAEPPEMVAQPARNEEPAASSVQAPSQAAPAPPAPPTPVDPPSTIPPQNPRRKRRAKGWSCPVCRQRKRPPHIIHVHFFFGIRLLILFPHSSLHILTEDYDHPTGRRKGRKARLDIDHRPPSGDSGPCDSRRCYWIVGDQPPTRADARGARSACAPAFVATCVPPRALTSPCCRPCVARLIRDPIPLVDLSDSVFTTHPGRLYRKLTSAWSAFSRLT